jgi:hypothetical protein
MLFLKWFKNSIKSKLKKNNKMMQDETEKKSLKKEKKTKQARVNLVNPS